MLSDLAKDPVGGIEVGALMVLHYTQACHNDEEDVSFRDISCMILSRFCGRKSC